jgi:putative ABC transport system permease protein
MHLNDISMFKNNLKIAWRGFLKDRRFSFINLTGLAIGLASAFLIYLWLTSELDVDQFQGKQVYQVMQNGSPSDEGTLTIENTPDLLAGALAAEIPEVKATAVVKTPDADGNPKGIIKYSGSGIKAAELYVTPNFFEVFNYRLREGNKQQPFPNDRSVLLSSATAEKLFHTTQNLNGKMITWDRGSEDLGKLNGDYMVAGIFDVPANSSSQFDVLFPNGLYSGNIQHDVSWLSSTESTYVVIKEGTDISRLNAKLKNFITSKFSPGTDGYKYAGTLFLQRYRDKYLNNHYENGAPTGGRISYVRLFSLIAVFLLLIACINFMNLSTAKASRRIKEVGIKKVIGASRGNLVIQYLSESVILSVMAMLLAIGLVYLVLPVFRQITGKELVPEFSAGLLLTVTGIALITGLISGSYPALYLSGFRPVAILKGKLISTGSEALTRKALVVFQFVISIMLIISVSVVYRQMQMIQHQDLGYNKNHIIHLANEGKLQQYEGSFINEVKNIPGVVNASDMEGDMLGNHSGGSGLHWSGQTQRVEFDGIYADYNFMETMGLKMAEGRPFSSGYSSDSAGIVLNETAIKVMGLTNPIGKNVKLYGVSLHIIGVVRDFHYESLYKHVGPLFISYRKNTANVLIKLKAGAEKETIARVAALYSSYNPGLPFDYQFLDADYQALYNSEQRVAVLSRYFAAVAILVSCLGLFGLAAFTAQKRQKEISIRKVVGASVNSLVFLLSKEFLKLVLIAALIAFPIALWGSFKWLGTFAYRTSVNPVIYLLTLLVMLCITLMVVGYQAFKAAITNPVKTLKSE